MVWTDSNQKFNDAFFLLLDNQEIVDPFPIWKAFSFKNHPTQNLIDAEKILDQIILDDPNYTKAIFLKAMVKRNLNYNEESILYLHQVKDNDYYLLVNNIYLAEYYFYKLKFDESLRYLKEVDEIYPSNLRVTFLLVLVNLELFNFEEAKRYLNLLYQISDEKDLIQLLNHNLKITEEIVSNTSNRLVLKNFKLKSINYNLQLKTNLINFFRQYNELGINYDMITCFVYGVILKQVTQYPNFNSFNDYNVNTILHYLKIEENKVKILFNSIDFEHDFVKTFEEYQEVENLMKEDL